MRGTTARFVFLGICIILAILLLTRAIPMFVAALVFALALVTVGLLSRGFQN